MVHGIAEQHDCGRISARLLRTLEVESVAILHGCKVQEQGGNRSKGRINCGAGFGGRTFAAPWILRTVVRFEYRKSCQSLNRKGRKESLQGRKESGLGRLMDRRSECAGAVCYFDHAEES